MAGAYLVKMDAEGGQTLVGGANGIIVYAADATDAKAVASAHYAGSPAAQWTGGSATLIAVGADLENWRFRVVIEGAAVDCTVTGAAAATVDTIGDLMVTALNATAAIAGAAYDSGTNVLTIAETTDGLGDLQVQARIMPPATWGNPNVAIASFVTTIVDGGASGDALKCTLVASTIPTVAAAVAVA